MPPTAPGHADTSPAMPSLRAGRASARPQLDDGSGHGSAGQAQARWAARLLAAVLIGGCAGAPAQPPRQTATPIGSVVPRGTVDPATLHGAPAGVISLTDDCRHQALDLGRSASEAGRYRACVTEGVAVTLRLDPTPGTAWQTLTVTGPSTLRLEQKQDPATRRVDVTVTGTGPGTYVLTSTTLAPGEGANGMPQWTWELTLKVTH